MAKEDPRVIAKKKAFLELFGITPGSPGWELVATNDAIGSAVKRNPTYSEGTSNAQRREFRDAWSGELTTIAGEYVQSMKNRAEFESDVLRLRNSMDDRYRPILNAGSATCEPGFRVAHAQKSLSLMLKHYWCHGRIEEPPACPVDRLMLKEADAPYGWRTWTSVNTLDDYRHQLGYLDRAARVGGESVAVWELLAFKA
jgi:hypothetical protein